MLTFSQSINLVNFNSSDTYAPGSGVSVHINPTGVFELANPANLQDGSNNSFILELSGPGGDFTNPTVLSTVHDFYTPLINGVLPAGLSAGQYKLRIRSTQPALSVETNLFSVNNSSYDSVPSVVSSINSDTFFSECLNDGTNTTNPFIGSLNQTYSAQTTNIPTSYKYFTVTPSNEENSISVKLIDIESGSATTISPFLNSTYEIPDNLSVGTYNFEVNETDADGNISVFSYTFLFHTSSTALANLSSETVCVGEEVVFGIGDIVSNLGITNNYMGSYYVISFGDGTAPETYTQAELLARYSATPADPITHIFNQPSCNNSGSSSFEVSKKLYNKGVNPTGSDPVCDTYSPNGNGTTKDVATAESPDAKFNLNPEQCIDEDIRAINATIAGSYPTANGSCAGEVNLTWEVKKPSSDDFVLAFLLNNNWLDGDNLIIPASDIDEPGCWEIKLSAQNPSGCLQEDIEIKTVNVEDIPDADFNIIQSGSLVQDLNIEPNNTTGVGFISGVGNVYTAGHTGKLTSVSMFKNGCTQSPYSFQPTIKIFQGTVSYGSVTGNVTGNLLYEKQYPHQYWNSSNSNLDSDGVCSGWFTMEIPVEDAPTLNSGTQYTIHLKASGSSNNFIANIDPGNTDINFTSNGYWADGSQVDLVVLMKTTMLTDPTNGELDDEVSQICINDVLTLTDASNIVSVECDSALPNEDPTYQWSISPNSGYSLVDSTTLTSQNPEISFTSVGNYTITQTVTTSCGSDSYSSNLEVLGDPTVGLPISEITYCSLSTLDIDFESEITPIYSTGFIAPTGYLWTVSGSDITSSDYTFLNGTTATDPYPEIRLNTPGVYNISVTAGSNCNNPPTATVSITLSQTPTITNTTNTQEVCSNQASTQFNFMSDVDGTTYSWIAAENENLTNYVNSGTDGFIPSQTISNLTNIEQDLVYTITPDADGCEGDPFDYTMTIQPTPVIADKEITICDGELLEISPTDDSPTEIVPVGTTYSWSEPTSNPFGIVTGGSSGSNETSISQLLTNSTDFPATLTYTVTPVVGTDGCEGAPFDVVVTVNPNVGISPVGDQILCNGENTFDIDFTSVLDANTENLEEGEITYSWINDNPDIGLAENGTGNISSFQANNSSSEQIVANITVTSVYTYNEVSCDGDSTTFKIIVNPSPQVLFSEDNQFITSGETTASVDLTSPTSGVTFAWTAVADNGITGLTTTSGTTLIPQETLFNTTTDPLTVIYTAIASGNIGFDCEGLPFYYEVTVNPKAQVNPVDDQTVCNDEELLIEFTTNVNGGNMTYSWTNDNSAIGLSNEGEGNIDIIASNTTDAPISANIVVTPSFENGGNINVGDPIEFVITVNPTGQVNAVQNQIVSNGFSTALVEFSTTNVNGNTTFNWENDLTSINLQDSDSGNIPSFIASNTGTNPVTATITVTPTFENGGVSCTGPATPFEITVNPTAQVNENNNIVVSDGDEINIPFSTINTGGITTYTWTNSDDTTGLELSGNSNIGFTATNTGTSPVTTTVVVTPTFENGGNSNSGPTETFTITVNPPAQVDLINNIVVCNLDEVSDIIFSTQNTGGTTTYEWTNDNISISNNELAGSGSTSMISGFTATNSSLSAQTATIEVTPTFTFEGNSNVGTPIEFTITVNPDATLIQPENYVFCNGDTTELISFATENTDGVVSFNWTNDNSDTGLTETAGDGDVPVFNAINNTNEPIVSTIVVTPTYSNNEISCPGESKEFTITVNPSAQVNEIQNIEICDGEVTDPIIFETVNLGDLSVTSYSWVNDTPDVFGLGESGDGTIDTFTAINTGTTPLTATITVTPTYSNLGVDCLGETETFTITVHPGAQVNEIDDEFYCNGDLTELIEFTTTNVEGTTEYNWTNSNESIGLPATGTGNIEPFEIINTSTTAQTATITVTPTYINNGVTCQGNPEDFVISVNPSAQVNDVSVNDTVLCNGEFTPVYTFETLNTDGLTSYEWTNDNTEIGLSDSGQGGIPSFQAINTTDSTIFAIITVTPSYDNNGIICTGEASSFTISVNPSPEMNVVEDIFLCSNEITSIIDFSTSNTDGETTYEWTNDNTSIGLPVSGNGDIPSFTALNSGLTTQFANISVIPTYTFEGNTCVGLPQTFIISVSSEIIIVGDVTNAYDCDDPNSGSINVTTSGGYGDYEFLWNTGQETEDLTNIGPGEYTLTVTDLHNCSSTSEVFIVLRQEDLTVDLTTEVVPYCENNLVTQENSISISGGFPPYTVNWSGGAVDISDNTFMTAYQNGVYNVLVTDQIGCQVNTEIIIDFEEIGEPSFTYDSDGNIDCGISIYNELEFINTSSGDYISVSWDFGDGSSIVSGDVVSHQYLNPGEYSVTQTVEYDYGCIDTYSEQIEVTDGYDIVLPTAFSPNNDGINDTMRPVYACVNSIEMSIYDTFGSLIYYENNLELNGWNGSLNGKLAENGNYLIVVKGTTIYNEEINLRGVFVLLR